jgi:hypothetical protein
LLLRRPSKVPVLISIHAVLGPLEELGVGNGPRRVGANDLTTDKAFGLGRIFDLFGHSHPKSRVKKLPEISVKGVVRHPAHGRIHRVILTAAGEGDPEHWRGLLRVLEKELVKVSHAVQQQSRTRLLFEL